MRRPGLGLGFSLVAIACGSDEEPAPEAETSLRYERIQFVGIHVADLAAEVGWYRDVLGLTQKGGNWFGLENQSALELFAGGEPASQPKEPAAQSMAVGLQVPSLESSMNELTGNGVTFLDAVATADDEQWIYFADPEGNRMEIKQIGADERGHTFEAIPWAGLLVERFDEMLVWYDEVLGLDLVASGGDATQWAHFRPADGSFFELFSGGVAATGAKPPDAQSTTIGLVVPDLDEATSELRRRGVEVSEEVGSWQDPSWPDERWTSLWDPEGNETSIREITDD